MEQFTRIYASGGSKLMKKGNQFLEEPHVAHVDSTFFAVFTFPSLEGETRTALNEPNTVVLTESAAKKYFGTVNAVGQVIEADKTPYKVTAVIRDMPAENVDEGKTFIFPEITQGDLQITKEHTTCLSFYVLAGCGGDATFLFCRLIQFANFSRGWTRQLL